MLRFRLARGAALALAVVACGPAPAPSPSPSPSPTADPAAFAVPVHDVSGALMEALTIGTLEFHDGCFFVQAPRQPRVVVIWPLGFFGRKDGDSAVLVDPAGPVYRVGEILRIGGGADEGPPYPMAFEAARGTLLPACQVPPYWIGGPVTRG
jgi:hypothetical protein